MTSSINICGWIQVLQPVKLYRSGTSSLLGRYSTVTSISTHIHRNWAGGIILMRELSTAVLTAYLLNSLVWWYYLTNIYIGTKTSLWSMIRTYLAHHNSLSQDMILIVLFFSSTEAGWTLRGWVLIPLISVLVAFPLLNCLNSLFFAS